jgi:type II secretory pathway component GspD/PulD (secretin)
MVAALLISLAMASDAASADQQTKGDEAKTKRASYQVQNRSAGDLAGVLSRVFKSAGDIQIVPDGPTNTLLVDASPAVVAEILNTAAMLDSRPQPVQVEVLLIDVATKKGADGITEAGEVDRKELSGPAEQVASKIKALENKGVFSSVKRFELKGAVNQETKVTETASKPYVTGMVTTIGVGGKPKAARTIAYRNVGTTVAVTAFVNPDGGIALDLHVQDERGVQPDDAPVIGADENGVPQRTTQFVKAALNTKMTIPNGHALLAEGVQMVSAVAGEQKLIVIMAKLGQ